jgi:hypothetical protein
MATKESIISRVQKLLAVAMDSEATEHERALAQEHADRLMAQHMIDQLDLKVDDKDKSRVVSAVWSFDFSYEFREALRDLLGVVMSHASCRCTLKGFAKTEVTVVGTPEGIAYAERLWLVVFTELARNMFPNWEDSKSFDANVYAFVKAGFRWRDIHEIAWKHCNERTLDDGKTVLVNDPYPAEKQSRYGFGKTYAGDGGRLKRAYGREVKRLGEAQQHHTSRHGAYRASYVGSYVSTIRSRLYQMRAKTKADVPDADRYALAVRSTEDEVNAEFYLLFPQFDPKVQDKMYEESVAAEQARRSALTPEQRAAEDEKRAREEARARKQYDEMRDKSFDSGGWERGNAVAKKVNLNNNTDIKHSRKGIER